MLCHRRPSERLMLYDLLLSAQPWCCSWWFLWVCQRLELLTLRLWTRPQGCDLDGPVGFSLGHEDFHALLRRHGDVRLWLGDRRQELVHVGFLLLEKLICEKKMRKKNTSKPWDDLAYANTCQPGTWQQCAKWASHQLLLTFPFKESYCCTRRLLPFLLTTN